MKSPTKKHNRPSDEKTSPSNLSKGIRLMQNTDEMDKKKQRTVTKIQDDLPSCHKIFFHLQINLKLLTKRDRKLQPYKP